MSSMHILVIECEKGLQRILSLTLQRAAFKVSVALTCREAEERVAGPASIENPVDLLLIDMNFFEDRCDQLPGKLVWVDHKMPIIALVGYGEEEKIDKRFRERCALLISKPVDEKELIAGIQKILGAPEIKGAGNN